MGFFCSYHCALTITLSVLHLHRALSDFHNATCNVHHLYPCGLWRCPVLLCAAICSLPGISDRMFQGLLWWSFIILVTAFVILQYLVLTFWPPFASFYQDTWPYTLAEPEKGTRSLWGVTTERD